MRRDGKIILSLLIIGIAVVAFSARPESNVPVEQRSMDSYSDLFFGYTIIRYPARVEVLANENIENLTIGFNTGVDALDFSKVVSGGEVKKQLNLTTKDGVPSKITLRTKGTIAPLLSFDKNKFILKGNDLVQVLMSSAGRTAGNYTGEVTVVIQRSNLAVMSKMLGY